MPSLHTLLVVAAAAAVLWAVPGPALVVLLTRGVDRGARAAVATAVGLSAGTCVHVLAAVVGLSALLTASATAFGVVKVVGALYLVWLGVQRLRDRSPLVDLDRDAVPESPGPGTRRALRDGFLVNVLNPKVAVFFLAFLPPFVDRGLGPAWSQMLVLGLLVAAVLLVGDALFAFTTGHLGRRVLVRLRSRRGASAPRPWGRWTAAAVYVGLGALVLATGAEPDAA